MIFISYSRNDIELVRPIVKRLRESGNECWLDESNIPVGEAFVRHLSDGLFESDSYLLFDTESSRGSYWVERERIVMFRKKRTNPNIMITRLGEGRDMILPEPWDLSVAYTETGLASLDKFFARQQREPTLRFSSKTENSNLRMGSFGQPRNWIGMQDELRSLDKWWLGPDRGVWLQGMGGSGKSGLLQTWVTALDVLGYEDAEKLAILFINAREPIENLRASLDNFIRRSWRKERKLATIDGLDETNYPDEIHHFIGELIKNGWCILASSRTGVPEGRESFFRQIYLGGMTSRDSAAFVTGLGVDSTNAMAVGERLDGHPLALQIFAMHLQKSAGGDAAAALDVLDTVPSGSSTKNIYAITRQTIATLSESARTLLQEVTAQSNNEDSLNAGLARIASSDEGQRACLELVHAGLLQVDNIKTLRKVNIHPIIRNYFHGGDGEQ